MIEPSMIKLVAGPLILAVAMHLWLIIGIRSVVPKMGGIIRSRSDLLKVRRLINLSMQLAVLYIALYVVFIILLIVLVAGGLPLLRAVAALFWFGVVTLPFGLWAKRQEDRIRSLRADPSDPEMQLIFDKWLEEWREPKFQLSHS